MNIGRNVQSFTQGDEIKPVTHIILGYSTNESGEIYTVEAVSPVDNGRTVELSFQIISDTETAQEIADDILAAYQNDTYKSYTATGAELDPASELGDPIEINGISSVIGAMDTVFNQAMFADISASGIPEEDDFPFLSSPENTVKRTYNKINSYMKASAEALELQFGEVDEKIQSITDNVGADGKYIRFDDEGMTIRGADGQYFALFDETELSFNSQVGGKKAWVGIDGFHATKMSIGEGTNLEGSFQIGKWIIVAKENGDLALKWNG